MQRVRKVLFPADMSEASTATVPFVEAMARHLKAELTLLHVMELGAAVTGWETYMPPADLESLRQTLRETFERFLADRFQGLTVLRVVTEGDPAQEIVAQSQQLGADLIMMPTHGYGLFRSLLLGSVTAKVLHDAACPVWTGAHMEETSEEFAEFRNVLCAVDLSEETIELMQFASTLANGFQAKLWLVHAVPAVETAPARFLDAEFEADLEKDARAKIRQLQEQAGVAGQICLGGGEIPKVIQHAAVQHEAGLIVIGRGEATKSFGRLRSEVYSIIRESPCPVISM